MGSSVDAYISFSFKGESYELKTTIDLDSLMEQPNDFPDIHQVLAKQHNIDTYSYLYDAMESHEVSYNNSTGIAVSCINDGIFDIQAFQQLWQEQKAIFIIQDIAKQFLKIEDIDQHPAIKMALLEALRQGKASVTT